jgi:D-3-phosphoglycerate dehydrogenase / 2-oxoglutarate reductase
LLTGGGSVDDGRVARVLVTERLAEVALDSLRDAGHEVDVRLGLTEAELVAAIPGAAALVVRSATQVTAEVLDAGSDLVVVGRAGIGLDNVDVAHATERGVLVVNAPLSNVVSAAEHTIALMLAQARNIPQAHMALSDGIVGLGRVGTLVAQRAQAFDMVVVATDPYVSEDHSSEIDVEMVELEQLIERSDFVTLHLARTPETIGLIGEELLARAKPDLRIVNVARGGIVDEQALAAAIRDGRIAGAAIDVFETEPTTESPLFGLPGVVVTPHLGASTREAQDKAGKTIGEQVALALSGADVPFAVNADQVRR